MKRKHIAAFLCFFAAASLQAQDIYKAESLTSEDLSGTARFVGMGGAMSALGADISTMGTNPAAIGLYRKSDVSMSGSVTVIPGAEEFAGKRKVSASLDQAGFVYAMKMRDKINFFNIGFNYRKRKNMRNYAAAMGDLHGISQALQMVDLACIDYERGKWFDLGNEKKRYEMPALPVVGYETFMLEPNSENLEDGYYAPNSAEAYDYRRVQWGGVNQYDINLSVNWEDRVYAGVTFGLYDVDIHSYTDYMEQLSGYEDAYYMNSQDLIYGSGFDVKAGIIVRPFEESPFRLGFSFSTPTFYKLTAESGLFMSTPWPDYQSNPERYDFAESSIGTGPYDFKVHTPWKINVSAATTVKDFLALDVEYELSNYAGTQIRNYYYGGGSAKDEGLCGEIDRFMKPVHTLRAGAEVCVENFYCRTGYNFVSAPFKKDAYLNLFTSSDSYLTQTNTDYINLGDTHRVACGFGYRMKRFYADVAYQYQTQKGDFYAFQVPPIGNPDLNEFVPGKVKFERHNVLLTIGCKF